MHWREDLPFLHVLSGEAELLREAGAPIGEIAARVGFSQPKHFGKCFRKKNGLSSRA